jgi:hypothetical protein
MIERSYFIYHTSTDYNQHNNNNNNNGDIIEHICTVMSVVGCLRGPHSSFDGMIDINISYPIHLQIERFYVTLLLSIPSMLLFSFVSGSNNAHHSLTHPTGIEWSK